MSESAPRLSFAQPIATERISDVIAERLQQAILDGVLAPGERLPTEARLAHDFGVGRTSVREGLQKLRAVGLIETRKGLGAFVTEVPRSDPLAEFARWAAGDPASIVELLEARIAVETLAAALAAVRATDQERIRIAELARPLEASGSPADLSALAAWDEAFHGALVASGRNPFVGRLHDLLITELTSFRRHTLALPDAVARSTRDHLAIAAAVGRHDPVEARDAMADHLWALYAEILETASGVAADQPQPVPRAALR